MYVTVNLKMKKPTCCFTWVRFIELNFTVSFLFIRKTWDDWFAGKVGGWGILRHGGILVMGDNFEIGGGGADTPFLWTMILKKPKYINFQVSSIGITSELNVIGVFV